MEDAHAAPPGPSPASSPGPSPAARLRQLAASQDGQLATRQALLLGVSRGSLKTLVRRGEITQVAVGVWRFAAAGGAADEAVTALLQCLPDGVISHRSAGHRLGIRRIDKPAVPEITVGHGRHVTPLGVRVRQSRKLGEVDIVTDGGIRTTTLERTVIDLADPADPWETLGVLDDAIAAGAKQRRIHDRAVALTPGRAGAGYIGVATDPDSASSFRSWLERAAAHVYRSAGIPDPEWNVPLDDERGRIGLVDALWRPWLVVAEKEGLRFHTTPWQRRQDADRFNRIGDVVTSVKRFTWEDVVHRTLYVAETVHRALRAAGADLDPARIPRAIVLPDRPFLR
jgi:hypothetical protein